MKKNVMLCVDLITQMKVGDLKVLDSRKGTLFRNVSANANHIKLELYIPHEDYATGRELADILAQQVEQMGDNLCEMDLSKVVEAIRALGKEASC